jgi:YbbR domain-containing protein
MKARAAGVLKRVPGLIFDHSGWKLLALATAMTIWVFVASEPETAMFATVRLEYKDLPADLEISSQPVDTISLELMGPSVSLRSMTGETAPEVILDMEGVETGQRTFPIDPSAVRLARGVRFVRSIPSEVRFTFEKRSTRFVRVVPRFTGQGQGGYTVESWTCEPREVDVTGPASHVARITSVTTDPVDVSGAVGTENFRVNAYLDDPFARFVSAPQVTITVMMKKL